MSDDKIGVFLCSCGGCVSKVIDMDKVAERARSMDGVAVVEEHEYLCSPEGRKAMRDSIEANGLGRVAIGACSPRLYEEEFRDDMEASGLNRYMVSMANLREQGAYMHYHDPEGATSKAVDDIALAIEDIRYMLPTDVGVKSRVNEDACTGCEICASVCPTKSITMIPNPREDIKLLSHVDTDKCIGCGICVTSCPVGAMDMDVFSNAQMLAQMKYLVKDSEARDFPSIIVFACNWCAYAAGDVAGEKRLKVDPNYRQIRTLCSARVDPDWVLKALSWGADGVMVLGGSPGHCVHGEGNIKAMSRMKLMHKLMTQLGFNEDRFRVEWVDSDEPYAYQEKVDTFIERIRYLGPNPLR